MSLPIQTQTISAFLGDDESKSSILLSDVYSGGGSENFYIDKLGRIRTILGMTNRTAAALTTNTGGSAARIVALVPYRRTSSGVLTRNLLAVIDDGTDEWELWYSTDSGTSFTFIADLGSSSVNAIPSFTQFGDELYIVNGVIATRMWNGTTLVTAGASVLAAPTVTTAVAGVLNGSYKWKILPRKTDGTRKPASAASTLTQVSEKQGALTWVADADTDVAGYEIYRTAGTGAVFFFIAFSTGRTVVTYSDNLHDEELVGRRILQEFGDAPPTGVYDITQHKGRVWYLRTDAFPRRLWHSDPGDADSVYVDENYIDCTESQDMGDVGIAVVGDFEGQIVVFLEKAIHMISGTGELIGDRLDWRRRRTNAQTGAMSKRVIVKVPAGAKYFDHLGQQHATTKTTLAYLTTNKDIRLLDDDSDVIISAAVQDVLATINLSARTRAWAMTDTVLNHIIWFARPVATLGPSVIIAWNYQLGTMHHWYGPALGHGCETEEIISLAPIIVVGEFSAQVGAWVYNWKTGRDWDNYGQLNHILMTKPIVIRDRNGQPVLDRMHRHRYLDLLFETEMMDDSETPGSVTVSWIRYSANLADSIPAGQSATVTNTARRRVRLRNTTGQYFHDYAARFKFVSGDGAGSPMWALAGMTLGYQQLKGRKRV